MGGQKMAAASIQRTLAVFAVAACLFGLTSIATAENLFKIPGTNYYISLDAAQPLNTADNQPLLAAIADWLSKEFGLPVIDRFPKVKTIASGEIGALRYNSPVPSAPHGVAQDPGPAQPQSSAYLPTNDTVAVYVDGAEIIYLTEGWTGRTPADLSVLVHEMVHHFQYRLGLKALRTAKSSHTRYRIVGCTCSATVLNRILNLMAFPCSAKRTAFTNYAFAKILPLSAA